MNWAQLYCAQKHGLVPSKWTLGILFNVHGIPLDEHGNEQIQVGFNMAHGTEIVHQSTWKFIEEVHVLTPSKGHFAQFLKANQFIPKSSY